MLLTVSGIAIVSSAVAPANRKSGIAVTPSSKSTVVNPL